MGTGFDLMTELNMTGCTISSLSPSLPQHSPKLRVLALDSSTLDGTLPDNRVHLPSLCSFQCCLSNLRAIYHLETNMWLCSFMPTAVLTYLTC